MGLFKRKNIGEFSVPKQRGDAPSSPIIRSKAIISGPPVVVGGHREIVKKNNPVSQNTASNIEDSAPINEPNTVDEVAIRQAITQEFETKYQAAFDELAQCIDDIRGYRNAVLEQSEQKLVNLAVDIAEKIIQKQVSVDPDVIKAVVEEAFLKIAGSDRVIFKVHPNDLKTMGEFKAHIESKLIGVKKLIVQPDPTIDQGGAIIETDLGFIDITIQEKLHQIVTAFEAIHHS